MSIVLFSNNLDFKGGKRQRQTAHKLLMWRYRTIQAKLMTKAHALRCRYVFVNAGHTSKLAFDGSGEVECNKKMPVFVYLRLANTTTVI